LVVVLLCLAPRAAELSGKVTRSDNSQAVSGAIVLVRGTALYGQSDASGNYRIENIPAGAYGLSCWAPGLRGASTGAVWIGNAVQRDFALEPPQGPGTIQGAASCAGGPCAGVLVQARQGGNVRAESISQPGSGAFSLAGLQPGNYTLHGVKLGYLPASVELLLPEPATDGGTVLVEQNLTLEAGASYQLSGVVGLSDNPLDKSGSLVRLNGSQPDLSTTTSSGGVYQLSVPAGPLSLTASHNGYRAHTQIDILVSGARSLNFILQKDQENPPDPVYNLSGRVVLATDGGSTPAIRARVSVWLQDGALISTVLTDNEGNYRIGGLRPGTYRAGAALEGYLEQISDPFELQANRTQNFMLEADSGYDWGPGNQGPGPGCGCNSVAGIFVLLPLAVIFPARFRRHGR